MILFYGKNSKRRCIGSVCITSGFSFLHSSRQRVDPRAASKQWIAEHMKQMTQTMDAIEQVNDNVDRDLQSSRMVRQTL